MTPQSNFMIVAPIITGQRTHLCSLLESMNGDHYQANPHNEILPFGHFDTLHTARLLIIDAQTADDICAYDEQPHDWIPSLALLGEVDGCKEQFLAELAIRASDGLRRLFNHCKGFKEHDGSMLSFLVRYEQSAAASYVNWVGRTVMQVKEEAALHKSLALELRRLTHDDHVINPRILKQQLLDHVAWKRHSGALTLSAPKATSWQFRFSNTVHLLAMPLVLLILSPLLLLITPLVIWRLRALELSDPAFDIRPDRDHIRSLSILEDHDVTNQFNVFGDIKPGLFRYYLLKSIMLVVNYGARHVYTRGFLARVRTIHFARWVFLNNGRSMYFASMYDGSLESYMDDFINKVAFGLNLTFSHGVAYPKTRWMLKGGAELEQEFKNTLRRHQLPTAVWYRADWGLTAFDMARNSRIRQGLDTYSLSDDVVKGWLSEI